MFFAALLLAVDYARTSAGQRWRHLPWLCLLAAAAAGAKGTVLPVLIPALGLLALWEWRCLRAFPTWLAMVAAGLTVMFGVVYLAIMAGLRSGTAVAPFDVFHVADFWQQNVGRWEAAVSAWLPPGTARIVVTVILGLIVLAGTEGVRLLGLGLLFSKTPGAQRSLAVWLGSAFVVAVGLGVLLRMDADSELYVILLARIPIAVLAAAFLMRLGARGGVWSRAATGIAAMLVVLQVGVWAARIRGGLDGWSQQAPEVRVEPAMQQLEQAMLWIRQHTEPDAVLIANSFTAANLQADHWGALDGTLIGVHYYYSALAERRMLLEGPNYLFHPALASERMVVIEDVFYHGRPPPEAVLGLGHCYLVLDHAVPAALPIALVPATRVYANPRIEIHRLQRQSAALAFVHATPP